MINAPRRVGLSRRVLTPLFSNAKAPKSPPKPENFTSRWQRLMANQPLIKLAEQATHNLTPSGTLLTSVSLTALQKRIDKGHVYFNKKRFGHEIVVDTNKQAYAVYQSVTNLGGSTGNIKLVQNLANKNFYLLKGTCDCEDKARSESRISEKLGLLEGEQHRTNKSGTVKSYLFLKILPGLPLKTFTALYENQDILLTFEQQAQLFLSMLEAFQVLVKHHINHDDINNENVLIDPLTMTVSIVDFGEACEIAKDGTGNHHQHYDLRKLFSLFNTILVAREFKPIAEQYINTWSNLSTNLQKAADEVRSHLQPKPVKIRVF